MEAWSELDRELLGAPADKPAEPVAPPVVSMPPQTASTPTAPVASVYTRLGPPKDGSGDHTIPSRLDSSLLAQSPQPAKTWQKLLGHLSSLRELVPMAVTHTRHIQLMLHSQWTQVSDSPYLQIYPDHESLRDLEWWASRVNLTVGRPFLRPDPTMTIVTDASMEGWGGPIGDWVISGKWSSAWAKHHINWLELQAVWLTLQHFLPQVRDTAVDVLTDNTTTVAYINKEGGTQSPTLCYLALDLWAWCRQHRIYLVANPISVQGETQPPHGVVPPQDSGSAHIRALAYSPCGSLRIGEEPQTSGVLLSAPLSDVERNKRSDAELEESVRVRVPANQPHPEGVEEAEAAVVSPDPPGSPVLAQPAVVPSADQHADRLSASDHTQGQPPEELVTGMFYPKPDRMRLAVWPLSANPSLTEGFHKELQRRQPGLGENRLAGFMIPVFSTTDDGAWSEVWVPLKPL